MLVPNILHVTHPFDFSGIQGKELFKMNAYRDTLPSTALSVRIAKAKAYRNRVIKHADTWKLSPRKRAQLEALLGIGSCREDISWSDMDARIKSMKIMHNVVEDFFSRNGSPSLKIYHITFADDLGLTSANEPVLKLPALRRKIDKAIRFLGLSAIVTMEIQALTNKSPTGKGPGLMLHGHALAWGSPSRRSLRENLETINSSRSWKNHFEATPVLSRKRNGDIVKDAMKVSSYLAKLPFDATYQVPSGADGKSRFRSTTSGYTNALAFRIAEGLSYHSIFESVFSVADGKHIRTRWKQELVAWHRRRVARVGAIPPFPVAEFWVKARKNNGGHRYMPYTVH